MNAMASAPLLLLSILVILDLFVIGVILFRKTMATRYRKRSSAMARRMVVEFPKQTDRAILDSFQTAGRRKMLLEQYIESRQSLRMHHELDHRIRGLMIDMGLLERFMKRLWSRPRLRRIEAAVNLGHLGSASACISLERRLSSEKDAIVKLYITYALAEIGAAHSVMPVVESLVGAPEWYRVKAHLFLSDFGFLLRPFLASLVKRKEREIRLFLAHFACETMVPELFEFTKAALADDDGEVRRAAAKAFSRHYPDDPACIGLLSHPDDAMKTCAIEALGGRADRGHATALLTVLENERLAPAATAALSRMCGSSHVVLDYIMHRFADPRCITSRTAIIQLLSHHVEYFIVKLTASDSDSARRIIEEMIDHGFVTTLFGFLSRNKNRELENQILGIVRGRIAASSETASLVRQFLDERMLKKLDMTPEPVAEEKRPPGETAVRRRRLLVQLAGLLLVFPALFCALHRQSLMERGFLETLKLFIVDGNYYLIYYSTAISCIYLLLLFISAIGAIGQGNYSRIKKRTFLFRRNILPGVSVIGPAYNEETNIIESVNSLLNLQYPDYEVIVVNDGSKDRTLLRLIEYFRLEKVDLVVQKDIATRPIRGVYRNKSIPKLTVVDKLNGGKADSLNAGINVACKDYFCGIDADSLLHEDSLLKCAGALLDFEVETVAIGGNIFPVNGCVVRQGTLESIGTPRSALANFQFIEYIRAFMAGRIGWARINSLLIISGAFGLFKRRRIVDCGGYLTSSGKFGLDTVGEDMELVVRLARFMRERKHRFRIGYSYNANCWTEVPERLRILLRQRDRWHRGLIEIFSFHRDMIGRPRFGRIGTVAMPYFLLFEILGPWIEAQGYAMVVLGAIFGLLNPQIAAWLFVATVMLGVFISIASIIIAEQDVNYLSMRDVFKLIGFAVVENFGFRQLMSMWRIAGYISLLRGRSGWGAMARRGFDGKGKK